MAWLESHGNLARHPKTRRLMQRMGWTLPFTIGNLHLLWYWALEYAPTGDLTKFAPQDITYDLDLGTATPEQFLQALIECGFIDLLEGKSRRLHDWPEYTNKCLRPKYRRNPERWHQVLRSYGLPVITRRTSSSQGTNASSSTPGYWTRLAAEELARKRQSTPAISQPRTAPPSPAPTGSTESVEHAVRVEADALGAAPNSVQTTATETVAPSSDNEADRLELSSNASTISTGVDSKPASPPIPKSLSGRRNFNDWWAKLQECYQNKGCPMTPYEQGEVLAMLARNPFAAVEKLQYSVINFETSYAALQKKQPQPSAAAAGENST